MSEPGYSLPSPRKGKRIISKVITFVVILVIASASAAILLWNGNGGVKNNDGNNGGNVIDTPSEATPTTWTGAIIPSSMMYTPTASHLESTNGISSIPQQLASGPSLAYFVGSPEDWTNGTQITFPVDTNIQITKVIGGTFNLLKTGDRYSFSNMISSNSSAVPGERLSSSMVCYNNIDVTLSSTSVVYSDYTFGIGTNGTTDYIWIAPHRSFPTFFNHVSMHGMVMDQSTLSTLRSDFSGSVFGGLDLDRISEVGSKYGLSFQGIQDRFLLVDNLTYLDEISVKGDVLDTLTPQDLTRLASVFCNPGTDWIKDVIGNIGEGAAFVTESSSTSNLTKLWILVYPLNMDHEFNGICDLVVSPADYSILSSELNKNPSSFQPLTEEHRFQVKVGMITEATADGYNRTSVLDLWGQMGKGGNTQVESVTVKGYGVVVDLNTMEDCLLSGLGMNGNGGLSSITTFKNPAVVLLLNENFSGFFEFDDVPFWHYGAICIIPNYEHDDSAFHHMEINGTLYDSSAYFSSSFPIFRIPLVISDSYHEVIEGLQQVSVKDMRADNLVYQDVGGRNGAYVEFDSQPVGTSLFTLANYLCPISRSVTQFLPIDLGIYLAIQKDGGKHYYVPVLYLSSGKGDTYFGTKTVDIKGMYVDSSPSSPEFAHLVDEVEVVDNTSGIMPTGVVFAFTLDTIHDGLQDAKAIGPVKSTNSSFDVHYSIDPSLASNSTTRVQLYWMDSKDWLSRPIWYSYGLDPTPGDGLFPVDAKKMHGDKNYGWFIQVISEDFTSDSAQPDWWTSPEAYTRVNYLPPEAVEQYLPEAPNPGDHVVLNWQESRDSSFASYSVFCGQSPSFVTDSFSFVGSVTIQSQTSYQISGLDPGVQYYFTVRVNDLDGFHSGSNTTYTRTYSSLDSGSSFSSATHVAPGVAWTEQTSFWFDSDDMYSIHLSQGDELIVNMIGNTLGFADIYAYSPNGTLIAQSKNIGVTEDIDITTSVTGLYYIKVNSQLIGTDWYTLWFEVI
ncbi:MAG TPA: hypothetical protein VGK23_08840 [Methanomassiliicoccales archaeon]|jgi:hypothetical protein